MTAVVEPVVVAPLVAVRNDVRTDVRADARARRLAILPRTLGSALLVGAGYVDPGNWGADVASGARFGHRLLWVLGVATVAALFLQQLAARLGVASGRDLTALMRERWGRLPRRLAFPPLVLALAVTEIVEVLGVVIGVQMLTSWSLLPSLLAATALTLAVLVAPPGAARRVVYSCLAVIAVVYLTMLFVSGSGGLMGGMVPGPLPGGGLPVAVGLVGAIVMPHNILLHSALARDLAPGAGVDRRARQRSLLRSSLITTAAALAVAFAVNCSIVSIAADSRGGADLGGALHSAPPAFGPATSGLFAITLVAAGLAAATTGGMVSADVLRTIAPRLRMSAAARRVWCLLPAAVVVACGVPEVMLLMWSQVVLTLALPLVLVPLIVFSSRPELMGEHALRGAGRVLAWGLTVVLSAAGALSIVLA